MWVLLLFAVNLVSSQKCHALVMSGGGSHGSYETGALSGLLSVLAPEEVAYHVSVGISAGSLNTLGLSMFEVGQETAALELMTNLWLNLGGVSNVLKEWPGGIVQGLLFETSLYSTAPLRKYLERNVVTPPVRESRLGVTSLSSGQYRILTNHQTLPDFISSGMSSSAIPGVMEVIHFQNDALVDGGVAFNMDVITGIQACLEETGGDESLVVVDMLSCNPHVIEDDVDGLKTLDVFMRARSIRSFSHGIKYAMWAMEAYPNVNYRYYIQPSQALPGKIPLDFKPESIQKSFDIGHGDALYVVANNIYARDVIHQYSEFLETVHVA